VVDGGEWRRADTGQPESLGEALEGTEVVVHLVAMLAERGDTFEAVVHQGAVHTVKAARQAGVGHVVYVSALGVEAGGSRYAEAKLKAETAVREVYPAATVVRPSLVLGELGGFRQQMEQLTRWMPFMVLPGGGVTQFSPVGLETVAIAIARACMEESCRGKTLVVAGGEVVSFRQLAVRELAALGRKRVLLPLPWWLTWGVAYGFALLDRVTFYRLIPTWLLVTPDQVRLLTRDNVA